MATPVCGKCGHNTLSKRSKPAGGTSGTVIYCSGCGAFITWIPKKSI